MTMTRSMNPIIRCHRMGYRRRLVMLLIVSALAMGCRTTQSPRRQVEDSTITAQIKTKLAADVRLSSLTNIDVNTTNGMVTLSGQVESEDVKNRAVEAVRAVQGVVRVDDNLQVETAVVPEHEQPAGLAPPKK
jgi:hypothetical protein